MNGRMVLCSIIAMAFVGPWGFESAVWSQDQTQEQLQTQDQLQQQEQDRIRLKEQDQEGKKVPKKEMMRERKRERIHSQSSSEKANPFRWRKAGEWVGKGDKTASYSRLAWIILQIHARLSGWALLVR